MTSAAETDREFEALLNAIDRMASVMGRESWSASENVANAARQVVDARIDLARATYDVTKRAAWIQATPTRGAA